MQDAHDKVINFCDIQTRDTTSESPEEAQVFLRTAAHYLILLLVTGKINLTMQSQYLAVLKRYIDLLEA